MDDVLDDGKQGGYREVVEEFCLVRGDGAIVGRNTSYRGLGFWWRCRAKRLGGFIREMGWVVDWELVRLNPGVKMRGGGF
jgi:hypothetical protein